MSVCASLELSFQICRIILSGIFTTELKALDRMLPLYFSQSYKSGTDTLPGKVEKQRNVGAVHSCNIAEIGIHIILTLRAIVF